MQANRLWLLAVAAAIALAGGATDLARAQAPAEQPPSAIARMMAPGPEYDLIRSMEGAWRVQQRVWPGAGATPITSGPYDAERRLIGNAFLQETMTVAPGSAEPPFTRTAYLAFNNANRRYEYVSLDTRYPRIM